METMASGLSKPKQGASQVPSGSVVTSGKRPGQVPLKANGVTDPVPSSPVSKSGGSASEGSAGVKRRERKKPKVQGEGAPEVRQSSTNKEQNASQHSGGSLSKKRPSQGSPELPSPTNNDSVSPPEKLDEQQELTGAITLLKKISEGREEEDYREGNEEQNDSTHSGDHVAN